MAVADAIAEPLMSEEVVVVCSRDHGWTSSASDFGALEHHRLIRMRPAQMPGTLVRSIDVAPAALHWGPTWKLLYGDQAAIRRFSG